MLNKVCEIAYVTQSIINEDWLAVRPILTTNKTVRELFNLKFITNTDRLLYLYVSYSDVEQLVKGYISSCYNTWFLLKTIPVNDIEKLDFLYTKNHIEDLTEDKSLGIIYVKDKITQ